MGDLKLKQKLALLIQKNINFEVSQDKLLVKGDLTVLNEEDKVFLKENKQQIIALIENTNRDVSLVKNTEKKGLKPLSFSQQSLWLLDRINNGSSHYNLTSAFKLKGSIDYNALNLTFSTILERHDTLRSIFFVDKSGEPVQQIQDATDFTIAAEELEPSKNTQTQLFEKIEEETSKVFDLTKDLLLSVRLLKESDSEHFLIVTMHHIASDGWSIGVLVKEFNILYHNYLKGNPNPLPELEIQYSDYASWQRQWLKGEVLEDQIGFWKKQLTDLPVIHNLPLDYPRPFVQTFNGNTTNSHIEKDALKALYAICKTESATLFMALHAAFSVLLSRYSNAKDVVVGTPIANREKAETAGLVGFFMNLLVLRSDLSKEPSFRELLRQSKQMLEESYDYQQLPFEKLVEELKVKRNLGHNPLFQVLLSLQNNSQEEIVLADVTLEPVNSKNTNSAKYDLSLNITETSGTLSLSWEYNTDLFNEETISRMAEHFGTLLNSLLVCPDENVFKVNMINEKDAQQVYKHLQGDILDLTHAEKTSGLFDYQVKNNPDVIAVICNDQSYSYRTLGEKADAIALYLLGHGVQNGDKVGICLLRSMEMVAAIFACFKIGAAYIPLDPVYSSVRLSQIVNDAEPKCILTISSLRELYLKEMREDFIYLDKIQPEDSEKKVVINCHDENTAYIIFTSGTTGKPKGIEVSHANLINLLKALDISFGTEERQTWLAQTSMNFDISVLELIWTISRGHQIVLQQSNPFKLLSPENISPARDIDFSIMFFGADKENDDQKYDLLLETAKYADKNGFTAIWTPERHFGEFGGLFPSPSVLSSAVSVLTQNINIRSGSVVLPLHDPIRVAEEWSIVDNLSNGRTGISIASGWHPNDFVFAQSDYGNRHTEMRSKINELKDLWNGKPVTRKNGIGQDFEVTIRPTPVQKELQLWITAAGNAETFKYAGEIGANVLTHMLGQSQEKLKENIAVYHKALLENGFKIEDKTVSLMLHTYIDPVHETAAAISEKPFKDYLRSSMKLMEPLAQELGLDIDTQSDEIIDIAYQKFSKENTLIGSVESCQKMLHSIQGIGVTEVACLVDFGVENEKVLTGLQNIVKTKKVYQTQNEFRELLHLENQKNELELIDTYKITHVQMTPSQSKLVVDLYNQDNSKDISSVKHWMIGGEPLNQTLLDGLSVITKSKLYNMYGPTETTVWSAWREISKDDFKIAKPILNTNLLLLNEFEQQVPVGVVGELYIGGLGVAKGYHNNTELTTNSFKKINNSHFGHSRFYKTGDLMRLNADGTFEYIGRKDNQVKINGYRVEPEEIESVISHIPGVKNCKVVPVTADNNTYLSAYIVKEDVVFGTYKELPVQEQAKAFHFPDGSIIYHQSDRQLAMLYKEIFQDGIYFRHNITVPENGLVLDVGANIGSFSIDVSQRQPSASVIAFEPIPQIFSGLKQNFEHRQIKGKILNYGVSNKKENAVFYYYPEMAGMSGRFTEKQTIVDAVGGYMRHDKALFSENADDSDDDAVVKSFYESIESDEDMNGEFRNYLNSLYEAKEVDCQLTTISDVIDDLKIDFIDLLKVDVEKSECLVLEGIRGEHWSKIHQLAIEVDGDHNLDIILNLLKKKGYHVNIDELAMSDADMISNENTYMLYAVNDNHKKEANEGETEQFAPQINEPFVRSYLKKMLPDYMNPKEVAFVPSIPLMENGKVNLIKLKELKPEKPSQNSTVKLNNQIELDIYRLWCEVLKKENIPYEVSIFEAGGNSIEIVLLHEKLQREFNINFSLVELFRNPTIQQQARLIQNCNPKETNSAQKILDKGALRRNARTNRIN